MRFPKAKVNEIKNSILQNLESHPNDIVKITAEKFAMSRKGVNKYLRKLANENIIELKKKGRAPEYLFVETKISLYFERTSVLSEDQVWKNHVLPKLPAIPENVLAVCQYGITEMVNNVLDHSESKTLTIQLYYNYKKIWFWVMDDGIGIFKKIQKDFNLEDPRYAIMELTKGKLTSDPEHHSGQGIFFTSRMFDEFDIISGNLFFSGNEEMDYLTEIDRKDTGTSVFLLIRRDSTLQMRNVFDRFSDNEEEDYGFSKTLIPVKLMQYEGENLVSRSQAKRLITRFEKFKEVVLDFNGVKSIGQGFADQVFRIFQSEHPQTHLIPINTNEETDKMIRSVQSGMPTDDTTVPAAPHPPSIIQISPAPAIIPSTTSSSASFTQSSWPKPPV